jgi:hypothetical protein
MTQHEMMDLAQINGCNAGTTNGERGYEQS